MEIAIYQCKKLLWGKIRRTGCACKKMKNLISKTIQEILSNNIIGVKSLTEEEEEKFWLVWEEALDDS
jgi:hypothetical protein